MPEILKAPLCEEADTESALRLIQEAVNHVTGKNTPITASTRIDQYFKHLVSWDTLECIELAMRLEEKLGVKLSDDDWKFLSGAELCNSSEEWEVKYAPLFTFGRLAELIAHRVKLGRVESVSLLGAASLSAGAFKQIEATAKSIYPSVRRFAPSTPILDRFRGRKLRLLWARLRAISANRIPPMRQTLPVRVAEGLYGSPGVLFVIGVYLYLFWQFHSGFGLSVQSPVSHWVFFAAIMIPPLMGPPAAVVAFIGYLLRRWASQLGTRDAILPPGVRTFGDAARLVSGERGGWCEKCGYDLTGLTSSRCPECGTEVARLGLPFAKTG